jgi:thiol-disulfide isomerase/thioredoxin
LASIAAAILIATPASAAPPNGDAAKQVHLMPATAPEILRAVRASDSRVVLVNVWATWCMPCRKEFPDLVRLSRNYAKRGLEVIFVSGDFDDQRSQVVEFLAAHGVRGDTYLKAGKDQEFIDTFDPDWSGALPATFIYDGTGSLRRAILESTSYERLEKLVVALLDEDKPPVSNPQQGGKR